MDAEFLKQVEQFSNLKTAIETKKRNGLEKANNKLIFAYNGGLFRADPTTILFVKMHSADRDLIMLDTNQNPIKITDTEGFLTKSESCYFEAMNEYHQLYEQIKTQRSVKKLMNND
tara:strand:- start:2561 stop:2908 length:348 start_codon:yes stop_codon:yes gene_type:complete